MGFLKAFQLAEINQIHTEISHSAGVLWLITTILLVVSGMLLFVNPYWIFPVIAGSVLSTVLVISTWSDARFGMIPNFIILLVAIIGYATFSYKNSYIKDVQLGTKQISGIKETTLLEADIEQLPIPVQKYIRLSGSIGKQKVKNFKAEFEGKIRKNEQSEWMTFNCEQHNFIDTPTRLFFMDARMKGLPVAGYHHFKNGKAVMDIRLLSLFNVQYAEGKEMNISETITFFNDMCCMAPATLIDNRIQWLETKRDTVKCSFTNNKITIQATLFFNKKGELINFISNDRYAYGENGTLTRIPWQTPIKAYKSVNGYYLTSQAELLYNYPEGDLCYGLFNLKNIEYNL
jgi:hypothetical protein